MINSDDWGRDPHVQAMRRIFAGIEKAEAYFLKSAGVSSLDERLRCWRQATLTHFERIWRRAVRSGVRLTDNEVAALYVACLTRVIEREGVKNGASPFQEDKKIQQLLESDAV